MQYLHILLPIVIHNAPIATTVAVLLMKEASPVGEYAVHVLRAGFEKSRRSPGTVIEIFRDNLKFCKYYNLKII